MDALTALNTEPVFLDLRVDTSEKKRKKETLKLTQKDINTFRSPTVIKQEIKMHVKATDAGIHMSPSFSKSKYFSFPVNPHTAF